jgi:hypothetical protein
MQPYAALPTLTPRPHVPSPTHMYLGDSAQVLGIGILSGWGMSASAVVSSIINLIRIQNQVEKHLVSTS